jgi:integrase
MQSPFKLTTASIEKRCLPPRPGEQKPNGTPVVEHWYRDTELVGFFLKVSRTGRRTFAVQKTKRGKTIKVTIGRYPDWSAEQARRRARELIQEIDRGINPTARAREEADLGTTLRTARDWHLASMRARGCRQRSLDDLVDGTDRLLGDWLDRPLRDIRGTDAADRHERLTVSSGPYAANAILKGLRAIWNTAARRLDDLPTCPVRAVTFNRERRRREPIPWDKLPDWRREVEAIRNPVRRDLQLFILLTGLRATDARTMRWAEVDLDAGTLHRPNPKGGEDRAFTIPLASAAQEILRRRHEQNPDPDAGWVWPSTDRRGRIAPVAQVKEQRYVGGKKVNVLPSPHRLRDTFATAAREAGVDMFETKLLLNHALPTGDVTWGYQRPSMEHLRACAERIAEFLVERVGG